MNWKSITAYVALNLALLLGFMSAAVGFITFVPESETRGIFEAIGLGFASMGLLVLAHAWKARWFREVGALTLLFACAGILLSGSRLLG